MKGYIPIEIPTKKYIAAYIVSELGDKPILTTENRIGSKLNDLLNHSTNERKKQFPRVRYNARVKFYVNFHTFYHRGSNLNETNIVAFNQFVEDEVKRRYRMYMDFYIDILPSFEANLPQVRKHLGIDLESWQDDSIKKDYYRYRLRSGKELLYKSNYDRRIISSKDSDPAF